MTRHLETPEELAREMARRSHADALVWFVDWLNRRDNFSAHVATENLAEGLETLAAELRGEAVENSSPRTKGLILAAVVLLDTASGLRVGDGLASLPTSQKYAA